MIEKKRLIYSLKFEDAGDDGVRKFKKLRRHALEGDLEAMTIDERRRERYHRVEHFLAELEQDMNWTQRVIDVRNWFKFRADEFYKEVRIRFAKVIAVRQVNRVVRRTVWLQQF